MSGSKPYMRQIRFEGVKAGQSNALALPAPPVGWVQRLVIQEVGGTDSFTASLWNSEYPIDDQGDSLTEIDDATRLSPQVFQFSPVFDGVSGAYANYDMNYGYESNELSGIGRRRNVVWLKLTPGGSGLKTFDVGVTIANPFSV